MADVTIESAVLKDGTLTVTGTGFTKTTTEVKIDNEVVEFTLSSDSELVIEDVDAEAKRIKVSKGDASRSKVIKTSDEGGEDDEPDYGDTDQSTTPEADEPHKTATPDTTPGDLTKDDAATTSDVSEEDLATAANQGAGEIGRRSDVMREAMEPDRTSPKPGEHVPAEDFRFRVENTAAGDLNMDPRKPYPTGNPPDPREAYYMVNGHYPENEELKRLRETGKPHGENRTRP